MSNITIEVTNELLKKMKYFYDTDIIKNNNQYALFTVKLKNCTITAYKSKKVLFQGNNAIEEASIWTSIKKEDIKKTENTNNYFLSSIGSDEVGTGDYFGPVVVVAAYIDEKNVATLKKIKITDSKKINDEDILKIAPTLFKILPYSLLIVNNEKYNEVMSKKNMNLNKLKAILHKQAITNLIKKINDKPTIIIDQFCDVINFNKYVEDNNFSKDVKFHTKAESKYASVASASIMARYIFLKEFEKLSKTLNIRLRKGASNLVDNQARELVEEYGYDILRKIAKLHFKNTNKLNLK